MKNKQDKCSDLKSMWDGASKKPKITSTSTPTPISIEVQSDDQDENLSSPPSNELQLALVQTHNESGTEPEINSPAVEDNESQDEATYDYELEHDPGKRTPIKNYHVNDQDLVRRRYIALGPCQPRQHSFPTRDIGGTRRFTSHWFDKYEWLEYSVELDAVFFFVCYLFRDESKHKGGDQKLLVQLAQFYPKDFSQLELSKLPYQLGMFVADMRRDERFRKVKNIVGLSFMLVETKRISPIAWFTSFSSANSSCGDC